MKKRFSLLAAACAVLVLNGCGGNGDGNSDDGPLFYIMRANEGTSGSDYRTLKFNLNDRSADILSTTNENLQLFGLAQRPDTGELYTYNAASDSLYTVSKTDGSITLVGSSATNLPEAPYAIDFNPVPDRIRLVDRDSDHSYRLNPNDGSLAGTDTDLSPSTNIGAVSYTNSFAGATATTLYAIDSDNKTLVRIGGVDGTPSPNLGAVTTIGSLGVGSVQIAGFDISADNIAYLLTQSNDFTSTNLYTVNLETGAATFVGSVENVGLGIITGFTVVSELTPIS